MHHGEIESEMLSTLPEAIAPNVRKVLGASKIVPIIEKRDADCAITFNLFFFLLLSCQFDQQVLYGFFVAVLLFVEALFG
ncbi:hypothetical protein Y032_0213g2303 [Ancylostoma ceylanicum]|uniref:Uncharacterized protein n=1 Tax=Ancylostoma ceylanicum TaxID=53326 RepID=A0A016SKJ8_9BILA|nr:hypothetical protein Y032_0213g2303 [Ancylostoma ceylanicum]